MKWCQVSCRDTQAIRLGIVENGIARVLKRRHRGVLTVLDAISGVEDLHEDAAQWAASADKGGRFEEVEWARLLDGQDPRFALTCPVTPPEVWGCGVTYRRSADFREEGSGIYDEVYVAPRPELFFKATSWRCVGAGEPIGLRRDSSFTAAEPELALVLGADGRILGYTLANDVSAWDIERQNPLYLPQSKIFRGCFAFGPVIVTPDEIPDPYRLEISCQILRGGEEIFSGAASTALLNRRFGVLVECLMQSNDIRTGTVLATGTGIIQPLSVALREGDLVTICCPEIGTLQNPVRRV